MVLQMAGISGILLLGSQTLIPSTGWMSLLVGGMIQKRLSEKPLVRLTRLT